MHQDIRWHGQRCTLCVVPPIPAPTKHPRGAPVLTRPRLILVAPVVARELHIRDEHAATWRPLGVNSVVRQHAALDLPAGQSVYRRVALSSATTSTVAASKSTWGFGLTQS